MAKSVGAKEDFLSVRDVSEILSVSRRTVHGWVKKGILNPTRVNGTLHFHFRDIQSLLRERPLDSSKRQKRILIIEDDLLVGQSLKSLLESAGFDADVVSIGLAALDLISKQIFDLLITDIRMPGMDGLETLKAIRDLRRQFGEPLIPEIVLTAYDDPTVRKEAERLGVREFILKPFEVESFLSILRENLDASGKEVSRRAD